MLGSASQASATSQMAALRTIEGICNNALNCTIMSQIEQMGGLRKIMELLSSPSDTCQAAAATLTRSLCRRGMAQAQAASCGPQLVDLLSCASAPCRTAAALAIKTVFDWITGESPAQMPIPAVLHLLIGLLGPSSSPDCHHSRLPPPEKRCESLPGSRQRGAPHRAAAQVSLYRMSRPCRRGHHGLLPG